MKLSSAIDLIQGYVDTDTQFAVELIKEMEKEYAVVARVLTSENKHTIDDSRGYAAYLFTCFVYSKRGLYEAISKAEELLISLSNDGKVSIYNDIEPIELEDGNYVVQFRIKIT